MKVMGDVFYGFYLTDEELSKVCAALRLEDLNGVGKGTLLLLHLQRLFETRIVYNTHGTVEKPFHCYSLGQVNCWVDDEYPPQKLNIVEMFLESGRRERVGSDVAKHLMLSADQVGWYHMVRMF